MSTPTGRSRAVAAGIALFLLTSIPQAHSEAVPLLPEMPQPDERLKADILVILGHPDDDTMIAPYLAKASLDEHRRIAVVYGTRGNSGDNHLGLEQSKALAEIREIEARRALAGLGISNVWFLRGPDTPGQDVLHSLESWGHGVALESIVRFVRLTRPEVILTLLPAHVSGENHEDHQAAAVIAVEAFDQAANPLAFPEQVAVPRKHDTINNYGEGLKPWQPKKIYFADNGYHDFSGQGPQYSAAQTSPSKGVPYGQFRVQAMKEYATQVVLNPDYIQRLSVAPARFIFGKSLVQSSMTGDIFEGIEPGTTATYRKPAGYVPELAGRPELEFGGPWAFYRQFWPAHDLKLLPSQVPPEASVGMGDPLWVPLLINNDTGLPKVVTLRSVLPQGWVQKEPIELTVSIPAHDTYPVNLNLTAPKDTSAVWQTVKWRLESNGTHSTEIQMQVYVDKRSILPQ